MLLVLVLLLAVGGLAVVVVGDIFGGEERLSIADREIAELRAAVDSAPEDADARLRLAYALQTSGRLLEALDAYQGALDLRPADVGANYNTGLILLELDDAHAAEAPLREVLRVSPGHALAAKALGACFADQKRYEDVIEVVAPASQANPTLSDLHFLLGFAYEQLGRRGVARDEYNAALQFDPGMAEAEEGLKRLGVME